MPLTQAMFTIFLKQMAKKWLVLIKMQSPKISGLQTRIDSTF